MDYSNLCLGCFSDKGSKNPCPTCGFEEISKEASLYLPPRTILAEKYLTGKVLGQGGFGITYLGFDLNLETKLAIKEFFPQGLVSRLPGQSKVVSFTGAEDNSFHFWLERFLREAKTLAKFEQHPNIVSVRDFFKANNTAYMVMSYIEGQTLDKYLAYSGGRLPCSKAIEVIMPVMDALREVHEVGVMHRDISPDNIFIDHKGRVILIDFGADRQEIRGNSKSLSVILKAGYAPVEQYRSRGKHGPWTDVYAVGATFYRCITGQVPPEAIDRLDEDTMAAPSQKGIEISPVIEEHLLKAMAVKAKDRYQTVKEFQDALLQDEARTQKEPQAGFSTGDYDYRYKSELKRGKDIEKEVLLSKLEADLGTERSIRVEHDLICLDCGGTGLKQGLACSNCKGKGKQQKPRTYNVKIPAKVNNGTYVRLEGQGQAGLSGGLSGDLLLKVKVEPIDRVVKPVKGKLNSLKAIAYGATFVVVGLLFFAIISSLMGGEETEFFSEQEAVAYTEEPEIDYNPDWPLLIDIWESSEAKIWWQYDVETYLHKDDFKLSLGDKYKEVVQNLGQPEHIQREYAYDDQVVYLTLLYSDVMVRCEYVKEYDEDESNAVVYFLETDSDSVFGPRNIRVGDSFESFLKKIPDENNPITPLKSLQVTPDGDEIDYERVLYGDQNISGPFAIIYYDRQHEPREVKFFNRPFGGFSTVVVVVYFVESRIDRIIMRFQTS